MSVENLKSTGITNATASPRVAVNSYQWGGKIQEVSGTVTPTATAEATSTYRFCRVPSNARISEVLLTCVAFTAGTLDIGIYQTTGNGGDAVDVDLFASAIDVSSAKQNTDVTYESGEYSTAESEKQLWEVLGLTADPNIEYDVVATVPSGGDFTAGVAMNIKVRYTI